MALRGRHSAWHHRSWIFAQNPEFREKAAPILDLYQGRWRGRRLGAPVGAHMSSIATSGKSLGLLAAWEVHRAKVFGRCECKTGIAPFDRLVEDVMSRPPYCTAHRVAWT